MKKSLHQVLKNRNFKLLLIYFLLACSISSCSMWAQGPWPGVEPGPPALGVWSLNYWTTRVVPKQQKFILSKFCRGEVWSYRVGRAIVSLNAGGENGFWVFLIASVVWPAIFSIPWLVDCCCDCCCFVTVVVLWLMLLSSCSVVSDSLPPHGL